MRKKKSNPWKISGPEIDLEKEIVLDSKGRRIDMAYVEASLAEVDAELERRAGRPSLSGGAKHSPHISFRISAEMKGRAQVVALQRGTTVSALAREAFERYLVS